MKTDEAEIWVAARSAVFTHEGAMYRLVAGKTTARKGSAILEGRENLFRPLVVDFDVDGPAVQKEAKRRGRPPKKRDEVEAFTVDIQDEPPQPEPPEPPAPEPTPEPAPSEPGPITTESVPKT